MTSTPAAWSATASSTVVAVPMLFAPRRQNLVDDGALRHAHDEAEHRRRRAQEGLNLLMERRARRRQRRSSDAVFR